MPDEPSTNAAVEFMRAGFRNLNVMERDEVTAEAVSGDYVLDDRRSGVCPAAGGCHP